MRIAPFYSWLWGLAVEDMWHDNDECELGLSIPLADRRAGTDHILKHCWLCASLNQRPPRHPSPRSPLLIPHAD